MAPLPSPLRLRVGVTVSHSFLFLNPKPFTQVTGCLVIGSALRRAGIIRPELWGDKPDFLQQGQLREALVKTGVKVSDIEVSAGWKGRDAA